MKLKLSEKQIQRHILDWLELKQIFHWRNNTGSYVAEHKGKQRYIRYGDVGSPDIFAIIRMSIIQGEYGQIYGIEVKSSTGKQRDSQKEWQTRFEQAGGVYILAYSLDDVMEVLG